MSLHCGNCSYEVADDAVICTHCGQLFSGSKPQPTSTVAKIADVEQIAREAVRSVAERVKSIDSFTNLWPVIKDEMSKAITAALAPLQAEIESEKKSSREALDMGARNEERLEAELEQAKRNLEFQVEAVGVYQAELAAYREGGLTEEILRRNDGYIKVGKGCAIVLDEAKEGS